MRMRPAILVAAGVLSVGLMGGTASATESAASATAPAAFVAAPATVTPIVWGYGSTMPLAWAGAYYKLNAEYTGCTNIVVVASYPVGSAWWATALQGTCTGTA